MKLATYLVLTIVLGTMFLSFFHVSTGMNMQSGMSDCPFMSHEETICPMSVMDHIGAWKDMFLTVIPSVVLLLALAGLPVLIACVAPNLLQSIRYVSPPIYKNRFRQSYAFSHRPLQELFSSGILHPKLF